MLREIYSTSDVLINPTYEDTLPTINIEALACGTPVITYLTGGAPETIDYLCGIGIERGDKDSLLKSIKTFNPKNFSRENCIKKSKEFDSKEVYDKYVKLYLSFDNKGENV